MSNASKVLEGRKADVEKRLKAEEEKLSNEKTALETQIKTLSQDAAQAKIADFQKKVMDFQKDVKDSEADLRSRYVSAVTQVTNVIKTIVTDMKKDKNSKYDFDIVIPTSALIYSEKESDISPEVLAKLNTKLKTIKFDNKSFKK